MDEILFRGKRIDNGEWVFGCYLYDGVTGQAFIFPKGDSVNEADKIGEEGLLRFIAFEVDPETVGQWSGVIDINDKKIFKDDIVKYTHDWDIQGEYDAITVVDFCCGGFEPMSLANGGAFYCCNNRKYEILGNIHDDPELLEE